MNSINVHCSKPYNIYISNTRNLPDVLVQYLKNKKVIIIADNKLKNTYVPTFLKILNNLPCSYSIFYIEALEKNKNYNTALKLCTKILQEKPDINRVILALGGGLVGDIAGFCAAITLRGLPFFQIPTTLLAQVDSAIGGKNGVNTEYGKNTLGVIYQPKAVFIDTNALSTLPSRILLAGYAECLKYALLFSQDYFNYLHENIHLLHSKDSNYLQNIIYESCVYKSQIIAKDEDEKKGIRYLLNLGHTFAHALELYNDYKASLQHGEAVAIGMLLAFKFSNFLGYNNPHIQILEEHLQQAKLPYKLASVVKAEDCDYLISLMMKDKKNIAKQITFILSYNIGNCFVAKDVALTDLKKFLTKELNS